MLDPLSEIIPAGYDHPGISKRHEINPYDVA